MDFLSENNVAGQSLLRIVARGSAILAELQRLSENIPAVFLSEDRPEQRKYSELLFDFRYLKSFETFEHKIDSNQDLIDLDEEFRDNHIQMLERFYTLFESVYKYANDFSKYVEDLTEGVYIQQTIEGILQDEDGKQLMSEAVYLFGVMLLMMDNRIDGVVRERLIISYYRYKGSSLNMIDDVCKLCRATGYQAGNPRRPKNYPEEYFSRVQLPKPVLTMIIGRLRSDDIYNQIQSYPNPDHRSTALSNQAAMLFIILYFCPDILHNQQAIMREIVDKHFPDNWVISYYMGTTIDLSEEWKDFKAAAAALKNTLSQNIRDLHHKEIQALKKANEDVNHYLTEGVLVDEFVLDNIPRLLSCLRNCNSSIRWLMLHRTTQHKKIREITESGISASEILEVLMNTAQFEQTLRTMFEGLLDSKQERWEECKKEGKERMTELSEYFSGEKALTRVSKDEQLQGWFSDLAAQIDTLDYSDSTLAGRKIYQLIQALEEVEQFHQIESSLQIKQFLSDTRGYLHNMIRTVNVKEEVLVTLAIVSDFSFAWEPIDGYLNLIQARIKGDPFCLLKLRATFQKLASILDLPLVRISQANSPDIVSVSSYYSEKLMDYVRSVLEIIPVSMFATLDRIINLQTHKMPELPTKLPKIELKDFAHPEERYTLAKATYQISLFTEGILAMETSILGIAELNPKKMLEEGIRRELVKQITEAMHTGLVFKTGKIADFETRLEQLAARLDGYRRSFEYIQDYVKIYGLKVWQEEFSRIINYMVQQECNSFLKKKIFDYQSEYQSKAIPIPKFPQVDNNVNFIGRLTSELINLTSAGRTTYIDSMSAWVDGTGREVVGIRTFALLIRGVDLFGVTGVDKLLCFLISSDLQKLVTFLQKQDGDTKSLLGKIANELYPSTTIPDNAQKLYSFSLNKTGKIWPKVQELVNRIGQCQLIRRAISNELNFCCKVDSKGLSHALDVMNGSVIADVQAHYLGMEGKPYPEEGNPLMPEMSKYLEASGFTNPFSKIYVTADPVKQLPLTLFLLVLSVLPKLHYELAWGTITCTSKKHDVLDGAPFIVGLIAVLKQFHASNVDQFLAYCGQYIRGQVTIAFSRDPKPSELPEDVLTLLALLEDYCKFSSMSRKVVEVHVPAYLFDQFKH